MPTKGSAIDEIRAAFEPASSSPKVPREAVDRWMKSDDLEAQGFLYHLLTDERRVARIEPGLTVEDIVEFLKSYFSRCFFEDPDGEWARGRYVAGWDLVGWFVRFWKDPGVSRDVLVDLKQWLAQLYREGDSEVRECLVNATLEHLFEWKRIASFFGDWKTDPVLAVAYQQAMLWPEHAGRSPLGKRRRKPA